MDSLRNMTTTRGAVRPFASRHPRLVLITVAAAGVGMGIRYQADAIKKNETAQRTSIGNYYVAVDRSGGGI